MTDEELIAMARLAQRDERKATALLYAHLASHIESLISLIEALVALIDDRNVKLAKAVEALDEAVYLLAPTEKDMERQAGVYRIVTTLAEIKGESHE